MTKLQILRYAYMGILKSLNEHGDYLRKHPQNKRIYEKYMTIYGELREIREMLNKENKRDA